MVDVDLSGAWCMTRLVSGRMVQRRRGGTWNMYSTAGPIGYRHFAGLVAAKRGLMGLTGALALDLVPHHVRINVVCPGRVRDDAALEGRVLGEIARALQLRTIEYERKFTAGHPTFWLVEADVADAALWLASDKSRHVNGSVAAVQGGYTTR